MLSESEIVFYSFLYSIHSFNILFNSGNEPTSVKECRVITDDWDGQWTAADCESEKHHAICEVSNSLELNTNHIHQILEIMKKYVFL